RPGQTLTLGATRSGARCYMCVRAGVAVEPFLGSASTHFLSGLGGLEGRALRKGDVCVYPSDGGIMGRPHAARTIAADALQRLAPRKVLRVTSGPQADWFSTRAQRLFYERT